MNKAGICGRSNQKPKFSCSSLVKNKPAWPLYPTHAPPPAKNKQKKSTSFCIQLGRTTNGSLQIELFGHFQRLQVNVDLTVFSHLRWRGCRPALLLGIQRSRRYLPYDQRPGVNYNIALRVSRTASIRLSDGQLYRSSSHPPSRPPFSTVTCVINVATVSDLLRI